MMATTSKMAFFTKLYCMFVLINQCRSQCEGKFGPSRSEFLSTEECEDHGDHEIKFNPKITRDPKDCSLRKMCFSLNVSLQNDLNDDYETDARSYCLDNVGLWKPVGRHPKRVKACADSSNWMDIIQTQRQSAERCPLPKGNYSFECVENLRIFDMKEREQKSVHDQTVMFYGKYKVVQIYYRNGRTVGCIFIVIKYLPLKSIAISPSEL